MPSQERTDRWANTSTLTRVANGSTLCRLIAGLSQADLKILIATHNTPEPPYGRAMMRKTDGPPVAGRAAIAVSMV
jgi:hypothetical protein